jgi:hypothetical protein
MNRKLFSQIGKISHIIVALFILFLPLSEAFAKAGCCSRHGGVAGCNSSTNYLRCKDGTTSPSCLCDGSAAKAAKPAKVIKARPAKAAPVAAETTAATEATTTRKTKAQKKEPVSTAGCCSRHGGVASCNKKAGYQMCKDGTQSTTCKC